jgi:hypothetical protein
MHLINLVPSAPVLFYDFFPQFGHILGEIFTTGCHSQIQAYHASTNISNLEITGWAVIDCLYNVSDAGRQITYAGTGVLLGLLPTILSIFGSNTWETALLSTKRPFLSFLLALGAPVVTPTRLFDSTDAREFLSVPSAERLKLPLPTTLFSQRLLCVIEYALALAAIANVTSIAVQLAVMAVTLSVSPISQRYHWILWTYIAAAIHSFGLLAFHSRSEWRHLASSPQTDEAKLSKALHHRVRSCIANEFQLCSQHAPQRFMWRRENLLSFLLSAWVSFLIVAHIIYGTTIFSSTQLVLGADAIGIIARYMASAIVCRAVLVFELYGLRHVSELELATN